MGNDQTIRGFYPGHNARKLAKTILVSAIIFLTVIGSIGAWLPGLINAFASMSATSPEQTQASCLPSLVNSTSTANQCPPATRGLTSITPNSVGADQVPDLSLPKTVVSSVDSMVSSGGVVQASPDNLTLFNSAVTIRLLGGAFPRDELLGPSNEEPRSYNFWMVEANVSGVWIPLMPSSDNLTIIGTNSSGTFVVRSMGVRTGVISGTLKVLYKATSEGPLKWNLEFDSRTGGDYRLQFSWWNITRNSRLRSDSSDFQANFTSNDYVFNWKDIPDTFHTSATVSANRFALSIDLGQVSSGGRVRVDPTVASTIANIATGYTFQRHVFYDPKSGNYWVFYNGGGELMYRSSQDGVNWSAASTPPTAGQWYGSAAVLFSGHTVFLAEGGGDGGTNLPYCCTYYAGVFTINGTVSGNNISWNCSPQCIYEPIKFSTNCPNADPTDPDGYCTISIGARYVNLGLSATGRLVVSYNFYLEETPPSSLSCPWYSESDVYLFYGGNNVKMDGGSTAVHSLPIPPYSYTDCTEYSQTNNDRSVSVPIDSLNKIRVLYEYAGKSATPSLRSFESDGTNLVDNIGPYWGTTGPMMDNDAFSCVADSSYGTHCIYEQTNGRAEYLYQASGQINFGGGSGDVFSGSVSSPTLTVDQSTNEVYAFAISGGSILMKVKLPSHKWPDGTTVYPITNRNSPAYLGSNLASASMANSSTIALIWTEGTYPYNVTFASVPIGETWSPYSYPANPWDGNGLAPYGQYFQNLGEYVSVSTGMITLKQTDLSILGRGLSLDLTRVYTEPYGFLNSQPYSYESYPWAPMGDGWQLNFPWMNNTSQPLYIHLWDGEGYQIPPSFWVGTIASFQNDQGEHFSLVRNPDNSITLYTKNGASYLFDPSHRLTTIVDATGNNTISFLYSNNMISCITDSVQRAFTLTYAGGLLQTVSQVSGSCTTPGSTVRSIQYSNNGQSLTSVTDPAGRATTYAYSTGQPGGQWILSRITYPTNWYTNYTVAAAVIGTTVVSYRVTKQFMGFGITPTRIRESDFQYTSPIGGQITSSMVTTINGTATTVGYTNYSFSFKGVNFNASDASHNFLRGTEQIFGPQGEIPREVVLVSPTQGYTNYYDYDSWGNLIYSRRAVNPPSQYQESFNAFYNNGLSPGFNAFQDTFSQNQGTLPDNSWNATGGSWLVTSGVGFLDNNFTSGWTTEVNNVGSPSSVANGDTIQLTATFTAGQAGYYRVYKTLATPINGTLYPLLTVRLKSSVAKNLLRVELRDGSTYFDPTDGRGDVWKSALGWSVALLNVAGHNSINMIKVGVTSEADTSISGVQTGTFDYVFMSNQAPSSQFDSVGEYSGTETTGQQEANFAWADIGVPDLSLQATVFIQRPVNASDQRVGLFVHHSTTDYKWMLVLHNATAGQYYLQLTDEFYGGWPSLSGSGSYSCPIVYNVWWTFNITVQGLNANGWATYPGRATKCSVSRTFSSSSPAASGTGFGLYAGGFSALFDNATVTTVSASITSTGFSNSFYQNGAPGPTVHTGLAGTGQLQNGTGSAPIETYYSYTPVGRLYQSQQLYSSPNAQWLTTTSAYDNFGNLKTLTDARGNQTSYGYSTTYHSAYLTSVNETLNPGGTLISNHYSYNFTLGSQTSSLDPRGYNTTYKYDILGRIIKVTYPTNDYQSYNYNDRANYVNITNENGWLTQQIYDGLGRLISTERFSGGALYSAQTSTYNWADKTSSQTDAMGNAVTYQYDALGRMTNLVEPDRNTTQTVYNDLASWIRTADENGVYKCSVYDRLGRLLSVVENASPTCQSGIVTNYSYDEVGNLRRVTTPSSQATSYSYDNLNRLIQTSYFDRTAELYSYDKNGNMVSKTNRNGVQTTYAYDSLNRLTTITYHGSTTSSDGYGYDSNGNLLQLQSQNATLGYTYDSRNRVTCETYSINGGLIDGPCGNGGGGGGSVAYGTLITMHDGTRMPVQNLRVGDRMLGYNTTTSRFTVSLVTSIKVVDTSNMLIINTAAGIPFRVDANPRQTLWVQNSTGGIGWTPVTAIHPGDSLFTVNGWVRVTGIEFAPAGTHVMYDIIATAPYFADGYLDPLHKGPTGSTSTPSGIMLGGYSVTYSYNGETLSQITYNDWAVASYAYDGLGRVSSVSINNAGVVTTLAQFSYTQNDQTKGIVYGNGIVANYTYTKLGQTSKIDVKSGATVLLELRYSYNKTGTVASVAGNITNTSGVSVKLKDQYHYDALNRVLYANNTVGTMKTILRYTYDSLGNRLTQSLNAVSTSYTYDSSSNELKSASTTNGPSIGYSYYPNGNLKTSNVTVGSTTNRWSYSWSVPGSLLSVTNNTLVQGYYAYDGLERMVEAKEGSSTTFHSYTGTDTLSDQFTSGASNDYVYANGLKIARSGEYVSTYYYHTDALGSTRLTTDVNHNIVFSDSYQAYGQDNSSSGSETDKFTGKPVSQTTGLYYYYSRWYDPSIGRFISQDPYPGHRSDPQSLNPYLYVENSPTTYSDPSGQCPWCIAALIGAGIGAAVGYGWCVADTGGWTSSECGKQALEGAIVGGVIGLTLGLAATDEGPLQQGADQLVNTADFWSNVESTTTTVTTDTTSSISASATSLVTDTSTDNSVGTSVANLRAGQANHQAMLDQVTSLYGETPNTGPGQLRVTNDLGTYVPDTASGAELKTVQYLSRTSQMQIAIQNAIDTETSFTLYVRPYTTLSGPMMNYVNAGIINLITVPLPD